jgi:fused signal recognition particle receptor
MGIFDVFKKDDQAKKDKLDQSLEKTKKGFFAKLGKALVGRTKVDEEFLDDLEEILVSSDVGIDTTLKIIERLEKRVSKEKYFNTKELDDILRNEIQQVLSEHKEVKFDGFNIPEDKKPYVIMVVGVNGVGKTTTIGKLAYQFKQQGKSVMLGAGDTFRAAAIDQLKIWSERADVPIIHREMGSDPASVAFDTVQSAVSKNVDVVILDTAGRLHNKVNLMNELSKVDRVVKKVIPDGPHETLLVLDASTGQNAIEQAKQFIKTTQVNTLAITKLDGTAKGGVIIGIVDQFKIPVKYIGVGEKMEDLQIFNKEKFVNSLFDATVDLTENES